jgi:hypothetical protein
MVLRRGKQVCAAGISISTFEVAIAYLSRYESVPNVIILSLPGSRRRLELNVFETDKPSTASRTGLRRTRPLLWNLGFLAALLVLPGLLQAKETPVRRAETVVRQNLTAARFIIADFDGDQKPDLATVNVDRPNGRATNYSIHLQFSLAPELIIGITAPVGGLQIVSRDVNGDLTRDLVVRTSLESNLVAVFLNDGHGKFTRAQTGAFPGLEKESDSESVSAQQRSLDQKSLLPQRFNSGEIIALLVTARLQIAAEPLARCEGARFHSYLLQTSFGRSPPLYFQLFS